MQFKTIRIDEVLYTSDYQQVIFINQENDTVLNDFFTREYDRVVSLFNKYDYEFVFLPKLLDSGFLKELIAYNRPDLDEQDALDFEKNFSISEFYDKFPIEKTLTYRVGLLSAKRIERQGLGIL